MLGFALETGDAVSLPTDDRLLLVKSGRVEIYLVGADGRWLVAVAGAGRYLFPLSGGEDFYLVAIGIETAVITVVDEVDPDMLADSVAAWVRRAGRSTAVPPVPAQAFFAMPDRPLMRGRTLAAEDATAIVLGDGGGLLCGFTDARIDGVTFIGGSIWLTEADVAEPFAIPVERLIEDGRLLPAVAAFTRSLYPLYRAADRARDAADLARLARRDGDGVDASAGEGDVLEIVARALNVMPAIVRDRAGEGGFAAIPPRARRVGFRARRIVLLPGWWTQDLGPLIVRRRDGRTVEALIWDRHHYATATGTPIGAAGAADVQASAYVGYAPLPPGTKTFLALGRYAILGAGADLRAVALAGLVAALVGLPLPFAVAWLFDDVIPAGNGGLLVGVGIALFAATLVQMVLGVAQGWALERVEARSSMRLTAGLTDRVLRLPARFFRTVSAADLSQRLDHVDAMRQIVIGTLLSSAVNAVFSIFYLIMLFAGDATLALFAIATTLVEIGLTFFSRLVQLEPLRTAARLQSSIASVTYETLDGIAKLRTAAAEPRAMARWFKLYAREQTVRTRAGIVGQRFGNASALYASLTLAGLFAAAALIASQRFSPGSFLAFLTAFGIFQGAAAGLCETFLNVMSAQPLAERARLVLEAESETGEGQEDPGPLTGEIAMDGIVFGYQPDTPAVLDGVSFVVRPGEHVAIVGGSGSGKSTILRLLLGFERPRAGSILFDGQDLASLDPGRVRSQIGVVLQASKLFAGSILENIRGAHDIPLDRCLRAAERAGLADDLARFPMGVHTPITEGAGTLSGGQRQRILIARAIAGNPRILFLDEATSALDSLTQAVVARTIDEMRVARITIAHRLSTVRNADRICVLSGGKVAEQGSYDDLLARGGLFADLARRQLMDDGS